MSPTKEEIKERATKEGWYNTPDYQATLEKYGYTTPEEDLVNAPLAALVGFGEGATLGLASKLLGTKETVEKIKKEHPVASTIGEVSSYLTPGTGPAKIAKIAGGLGKAGLKKWASEAAAKKLLTKVGVGATEGAAVTAAIEGTKTAVSEDRKFSDLPKEIAIGTVAGGVAGPVISKVGKGVEKLGRKFIGTGAGVTAKDAAQGITSEAIDKIPGMTVSAKLARIEDDLAKNRQAIEESLTKTPFKVNLKNILESSEKNLLGTGGAPKRDIERKAVVNAYKQLNSNLFPKGTTDEINLLEADDIRASLSKLASFEETVDNSAKQKIANDLYERLRSEIDLAVGKQATATGEHLNIKRLNENSSNWMKLKAVLERKNNPEAISPDVLNLEITKPLSVVKATGTIPGEVIAKTGRLIQQVNPLTRLTPLEKKITEATPIAKKYAADLAERIKVDPSVTAESLGDIKYLLAPKILDGTATEKELVEFGMSALQQSARNALSKTGIKATPDVIGPAPKKGFGGEDITEKPLSTLESHIKPKGPEELSPTGGIETPKPTPTKPVGPSSLLQNKINQKSALQERLDELEAIGGDDKEIRSLKAHMSILDRSISTLSAMEGQAIPKVATHVTQAEIDNLTPVITKNSGAEALKFASPEDVAKADQVSAKALAEARAKEQLAKQVEADKAAGIVRDERGNKGTLVTAKKDLMEGSVLDQEVPPPKKEVTAENVPLEIQEAQDKVLKAEIEFNKYKAFAANNKLSEEELDLFKKAEIFLAEKRKGVADLYKKYLGNERGSFSWEGQEIPAPFTKEGLVSLNKIKVNETGVMPEEVKDIFIAKANERYPKGINLIEDKDNVLRLKDKIYYYYNDKANSTHVVVFDTKTGEFK